MTDENSFQQHLDEHPDDHTARMVFADYLDEQNDPRAAGYRALGKLRRNTISSEDSHWFVRDGLYPTSKIGLPDDWFSLISDRPVGRDGTLHPDYTSLAGRGSTRRQEEDKAAHAFSQLPPERQAELLGQSDPQQTARTARARKRLTRV